MGSLPLQPTEELEVEQAAMGRPAKAGLAAEVDGSPTAMVEEDRTTGLQVECRPSGICAEHPRRS
jgi:hypothetical protein